MSGVQIELPVQWVADVERADACHQAALGAVVRDRNATTKDEFAAACREFARVLRALPYGVQMPDGLGWALRHHAVVAFEAEARDAEQWAQSMRDAGEW